jgi:hypothetical protein
MSAFDALTRHGTPALLRFLATLTAFVALHLLRLPLLATARLLETLMRRLDTRLSALTDPATRPHRWGDRWGEAIPRRPARAR